MGSKGAKDVGANDLIVTTGSQQGLDLLGKTLVSPGDKVIVEMTPYDLSKGRIKFREK